MNRLAQDAVIVGLARRLREHGSWTGETHLQKATYLLRELLKVPFEFDFILYKHGPFSFGLRDELSTMHVDQLIDRETQSSGYGPRIVITERGLEIEQRFQRTMARYEERLEWIAARLGDRGAADLERLAIALWVTRQMNRDASVQDRAGAIHELEPHFSLETVEGPVEQVDRLIGEAPSVCTKLLDQSRYSNVQAPA
ncbi:MAG: hypothetical protein ACRDK7_04370 [Solirubrobacteraceae bacterium]